MALLKDAISAGGVWAVMFSWFKNSTNEEPVDMEWGSDTEQTGAGGRGEQLGVIE